MDGFGEMDRLSLELDESVSTLNLPTKTLNGLTGEGITTIRELLSRTPEELLQIDNIGDLLLEGIFAALEQKGFYRDGRKHRPRNKKGKQLERRERMVSRYLGIRVRKEE